MDFFGFFFVTFFDILFKYNNFNDYLHGIYVQREWMRTMYERANDGCGKWKWMDKCHCLCFHQLSIVAEDGSTFVCPGQWDGCECVDVLNGMWASVSWQWRLRLCCGVLRPVYPLSPVGPVFRVGRAGPVGRVRRVGLCLCVCKVLSSP